MTERIVPTVPGYCILLVGLVSGLRSHLDGEWLIEYDPECDGIAPDGSPMNCYILTDPNPAYAKVFPTLKEAMDYTRRVSQRDPVRASDGGPNRPLTAYSLYVAKFS